MARKKFFLIIDTETTQTDKVADFGAIVCDKQGNIHHSAGCLVREYYLDKENHPLFHSKDNDPLWGQRNLPKRYANYDNMLSSGTRMLASVAAINKWLVQVNVKYQPVMTAYNLPFDRAKCRNTGIDLEQFNSSFCLWAASVQRWAYTKAYRQFILDNHLFTNRTQHGNMSFMTKADYMAKFLLGPDLPPEPHTALEDARDYELPILANLVKSAKVSDYMGAIPYNWRKMQVKDWFKPA